MNRELEELETVVQWLRRELETGSDLDAARTMLRVAKVRQGQARQRAALQFPVDEHETTCGTPHP